MIILYIFTAFYLVSLYYIYNIDFPCVQLAMHTLYFEFRFSFYAQVN